MTKAMYFSGILDFALYHHIQEVKKRSILEKRLKTRERNKHQGSRIGKGRDMDISIFSNNL